MRDSAAQNCPGFILFSPMAHSEHFQACSADSKSHIRWHVPTPQLPRETCYRKKKQHKIPLGAFSLNLRPSWQLNKFLPSRGMEERPETDHLATGASLKSHIKGRRRG